MKTSVFEHYNARFDALNVMRKYAALDLCATPGFLTNFLGVKIEPDFLPSVLRGREGEIESLPNPANWHADLAEWGAVLRAVDLAPGPSFAMAELGCGWGCWMSNSGTAARRRGLRTKLIGVEGDAGHCEFARRCLKANNFDESQYSVLHGIASAKPGEALFPKQQRAGTAWGLKPIIGASPYEVLEAAKRDTHDVVPLVPLEDLLGQEQRLDLLHIDIQGGESSLLAETIEVLNSKVAYIVVGTHSRQIEGELMGLLLGHGWLLEMERPAILSLSVPNRPEVAVDGVQGWMNPKLSPLVSKFSEKIKSLLVGCCRRLRALGQV